jgi:hypothetical protein
VDERVVYQLVHGQPLLGVFMETAEDETLGVVGDGYSLGEIDVFVDDLDEVVLSPDLEGHASEEQLIGEDACMKGYLPMFHTSTLLSYCCFCTTSGEE